MASKAATALLARIVAIVNEHTDERTYMATSRLSTPVLTEHIDVLSQPDGSFVSPEALAAAVELSKMVNCVQDGSHAYKHPAAVGAAFVTDVYKKALGDIEFARAPLTADQKADVERAEAILYVDAPFVRTESYTQFAGLRIEVASREIDRSETLRSLEQADEAEKDVIERRLEAIDAELHANRALLAALDAQHGFTRAEEIYNCVTVAGFPPKFERIHALLDDPAFEITNPISNESHWPAAFFPNHLTEENWIPIKLTRADIANANVSGSDNLPDLPPAAQDLTLNDEALDLVELEVQLLRVDRPWMWGGIFQNKQWRFRPGVEPWSNGESAPVGRLPAFVSGLMFARNMRLSGRKNIVDAPGGIILGGLVLMPVTAVFAHEMINAQNTPFATATLNIADKKAMAFTESEPPTSREATAQKESSSMPAFNMLRLNNRVHTAVSIPRIVATVNTIDGNNNSLEGVDVTLTDSRSGSVLKGVSNKSGTVIFRLNAEGRYAIVASKQGFKAFTTETDLQNGQSFTVRLDSLTPIILPHHIGQLISHSFQTTLVATTVSLGNTVTVKLRKRDDDGLLKPLDVPAEVVAINRRTRERRPQTVEAGKDAFFTNLATETYDIGVYCAVYEPEGPTTRPVDPSTSPTLEFSFRPRTILQSNDTFLFGFLCYRTPLSPDPDPNAEFEG